MNSGIAAARSEANNHAKQWAVEFTARFEGNVPFRAKDKYDRGYKHPICGRLTMTPGKDYEDPK